jgi:hypothetical protein
MRRKPLILGGLYFIAGYIWAALQRIERPVSPELIRFHRGEQMTRFRKMFHRSGRPVLGSSECATGTLNS